jgi:hypothetical protein
VHAHFYDAFRQLVADFDFDAAADLLEMAFPEGESVEGDEERAALAENLIVETAKIGGLDEQTDRLIARFEGDLTPETTFMVERIRLDGPGFLG